MKTKHKITGGIYLVIDPSIDTSLLLSKLEFALKAGLAAVQLWANWLPEIDKPYCIRSVSMLCRRYGVPLLIDNDWELMLDHAELDGVHFDKPPQNLTEIRKTVGRPFITGITCAGNIEVVKWAQENEFDYVSFCAMFPSPSAGSCNIVMPSTVKAARQVTSMPLFVSGGITPENIISLRKLTPFDGVAVISGIMSATDPYGKVELYHNALKTKINQI